MTHTECIYKLRAQQALPARWVICLRKNKEIASLYSFVFSTRKLFATDRHRLNIPSDIPSSCYTALHVYLGGILRLTDTCVFISWDVKCPTSKEWIRTIDIHSLSRGTDQPFNHILTDEGKSRPKVTTEIAVTLQLISILMFDFWKYLLKLFHAICVKPCGY